MNKFNKNPSYDEIEINVLFFTLWRAKVFLILCMFISVFLASLYIQSVKKKYTVEYSLKPVSESSQSPSLGQLGGLAALSGIGLPKISGTDFDIFMELLTSIEVSEVLMLNKDLIRRIFSHEWNNSLNEFIRPEKSKIRVLINDLENLLTGYNTSYISPNSNRLSLFLKDNIIISESIETGFVSLRSQTSKPELIKELIVNASKVSDDIMRQRYIDFSTEPLAFYKQKLSTARSREHREALAELISKEEQKLMFASRGKYFIAEPYINPTISLYPTAPRPKSILALSLVLGLFIGATFVLIRHAIKKENQ